MQYSMMQYYIILHNNLTNVTVCYIVLLYHLTNVIVCYIVLLYNIIQYNII